jgi:hypothetical protein
LTKILLKVPFVSVGPETFKVGAEAIIQGVNIARSMQLYDVQLRELGTCALAEYVVASQTN